MATAFVIENALMSDTAFGRGTPSAHAQSPASGRAFPQQTVLNRRRRGLNPGPSVYKTDALPLSYRGRCDFHHTMRHKALHKGENPITIIQLYARTRSAYGKTYGHTYSLFSFPLSRLPFRHYMDCACVPLNGALRPAVCHAMQLSRAPEQARRDTSPDKNKCDKQVSGWRHISCHTDKNRYYT